MARSYPATLFTEGLSMATAYGVPSKWMEASTPTSDYGSLPSRPSSSSPRTLSPVNDHGGDKEGFFTVWTPSYLVRFRPVEKRNEPPANDAPTQGEFDTFSNNMKNMCNMADDAILVQFIKLNMKK